MAAFLRIKTPARCSLQSFRQLSALTRSTGKYGDNINFEFLSAEAIKPYQPVQIAGRPYLPGTNSSLLPKYLKEPKENFPLIAKLKDYDSTSGGDLGKWLKEFLDLKLLEYPAVLIKNLPFKNVTELSKLVLSLRYQYLEYIGGAVDRTNIVDFLNTASNDPPEFTVELHNEMAYSLIIPHKSPQGGGGEAVIADNKVIMENLDEDVLKKFQEKGLKYISYLPNRESSDDAESYMPWQQRLLTECPREAETRIKSLGYSDFFWHDDGGLRYWLNLPALRTHPVTGKSIWCNQAISHHKSYFWDSPMNTELKLPEEKLPYNTQYGDGSDIEPEVVEHVRKVTWENSIGFAWEAGDMLVLDNYMVQHGRMSYTELVFELVFELHW